MDAHVGLHDDGQFVADMAVDAVKSLEFFVVTVLVGIMFLPLFAYGLMVTVWNALMTVDWSAGSHYVSEARYDEHLRRVNT